MTDYTRTARTYAAVFALLATLSACGAQPAYDPYADQRSALQWQQTRLAF